MRKRKSGSAPRGIGFPLILGAIAVFYYVSTQSKKSALNRIASTGYAIREEDAAIARGGVFPH